MVVEFEDTEKQTRFLLGLAADCYEDLHYDYKWFTVDKMGIPENCFTNPRTNTPYTIPQLKRYLRDSRKHFEIIDTNRRYQEIIMGKYGAVKRKYLVLLKKAVPFTPITDIEKFITESICDVRNNIQIEQMQSDIRQYKNLEADAARTHEKVIALREIESLTEEYEADRERYRLQSYIILRALREEAEQEAARIRDGIREQGYPRGGRGAVSERGEGDYPPAQRDRGNGERVSRVGHRTEAEAAGRGDPICQNRDRRAGRRPAPRVGAHWKFRSALAREHGQHRTDAVPGRYGEKGAGGQDGCAWGTKDRACVCGGRAVGV